MSKQAENTLTAEQMAEFMAMREKLARIRERQRSTGERLRAKNAVLIRKAREAGLTVTEREIMDELARMSAQR